jgi:hypothetical protein
MKQHHILTVVGILGSAAWFSVCDKFFPCYLHAGFLMLDLQSQVDSA